MAKITSDSTVSRRAGARLSPAQIVDRYFFAVGLAPAVVCLLAILVYPVVSNIAYSFTNMSFVYPDTSFIGLKNYADILTNSTFGFWSALDISVIWTVATVSLQFLVGLIGALLLDQAIFGSSAYRVLLLIPWAFPGIVTAYVWRWLLNDQGGFVTWLALTAGIIQQPVAWLAEANTALPAVVGVAVWAGYPFMLAAMLAGLQSIPVEYHEVAQIEGASVMQELFSVTLPLLRPIVVIVLVLRTIWTFNAFDLIYLLTNGGPDGQTLTLPILAYDLGWQQYLPGKAAAMSMLMLIVLAIGGVIYFRASSWAQKEGHRG